MKKKFNFKTKSRKNLKPNAKSKMDYSKFEGKLNDISWYNQNPLLTKMAGLVNFLRRVGSKLPIFNSIVLEEDNPSSTTYNQPMQATLPGICTLGWLPTIGVSKDPESPFNKAMNKFFTALRLKNFSTSVYDPADVGFYFIACDSAFAMYAYLTMIYAHLKKFSFVNKYHPRAVIESMNVDYDDVVSHMAEFVFYINKVQNALSVIRVPKSLSFIARHMHMSAQIYKDTESEKAQLYQFIPDVLYKYNATVPKMEAVAVGNSATKLTYANLVSLMDGFLSAILPDEDTNIIAADVQKYLETDYWTVNPIDWNAQLEPVYNQEMLWQIHNADFLPYTSVTSLDITQAVTANLDTIVVWNPTFTSKEPGVAMNRIIDSQSDSPSPEEVVESTRLKFTVLNPTKQGTDGTLTFTLGSCGTELITHAKLTMFQNDGNLETRNVSTFLRCTTANITGVGYVWYFSSNVDTTMHSGASTYRYGDDLFNIVAMSTFNYRPITSIWYVRQDNTSWNAIFGGFVSPLDNYAVIENQQLDALNEQSLLSEFDLGSKI